MSMSSCIKCWDTPCTCGYDYRNYDVEKLVDFLSSVLSYHDKEVKLRVLNRLVTKIETE